MKKPTKKMNSQRLSSPSDASYFVPIQGSMPVCDVLYCDSDSIQHPVSTCAPASGAEVAYWSALLELSWSLGLPEKGDATPVSSKTLQFCYLHKTAYVPLS
jgi:hypothetical protein